MLRRSAFVTLISVALASASFAANAAILFSNLGTAAPPSNLGAHTMTPFDRAPQTAIPELAAVSSIPGGPAGVALGISPAALKATDGIAWNAPTSWPGGVGSVVYFSGYGNKTETLTLPANTKAFYFYVESNLYGTSYTYTATTNSGATSTPVVVVGNGGAHGFAFYSTAGEYISNVTVTGTDLGGQGFVVGEFGINVESTTCASEGYKGAQLTWCKNICENGLTGQVLDTWIHRWINRYRDLPYCARETTPPPPPPAD